MITPEIVEQLTPERIKALSAEEKREALTILEALEIPRLERQHRAWERMPTKEKEQMAAGHTDRLIEARKRLHAM